MSHESLRGMLNRVPFVPFRIHVSDQSSYLITRPQLVFPGSSDIVIGIVRDGVESDLWDEPVIVANRHITRLEPVVAANTAT